MKLVKRKVLGNLLLVGILLLSMLGTIEVRADDTAFAYGGTAVGIRNNTEYYIMNYSSGRFMSLETTADENLSNVYTRTRSETTMSQWRTELQSDGTYQLVSVYNPSSKVLDVTSGNVDIYTDNGGSYLKFNIQRISTGVYQGLYYITQGSLYVTEDTDYNVMMSEVASASSVWSIMAVEKRDADIYSFNYDYVDSDGNTRTYNSSGNNDYFTSIMMNKEYNSYAFNNTSASSAYTYLCGYDDVFVFRGHGAPGLIGFRNNEGGFNGRIVADSVVNSSSQNRYISSCENNELSSLKCVLYLGCNTGKDEVVSGYTYNLVTATYNKGAHFVLGTTATVITGASDKFLKGFTSGISSDKAILGCVQEGIETAGQDSKGNSYPIVYVGDTAQYLCY